MYPESDRSTNFETTYDALPWLEQYPADIPPHLDYPNQTMWELVEEIVSRHGEKTAYIFQDQPLTFKQVHALAGRMSGLLVECGVRRGDVILLVLPNVPHFPITYYGALRLGAAIAAAPPNAVEREIENVIRDSGARAIVVLDLLFDKVAGIWERVGVENVLVGTAVDFMPPWVRLGARATGKVPRPKQPVPYGGKIRALGRALRRAKTQAAPNVSPDDVALLQYTGGTTGLPKAALLTHRNLLANARQMSAWFPTLHEGTETILAVLPFFHVYGVTLAMNAGLLLAARTVLIPRPVAADIFEAISKYRPTVFPGVPTLYVSIVNDPRAQQYDLSSIDICVCGGAPLPYEVKRDFERLTGGHLYEGYGLSEASPVTHAVPYDGRGKAGSIGLPLPDTKARLVDDQGNIVPVGDDGELVVFGPQVMSGYWRRPEDTADVLHDGWLRTGDIARMDDEGWFYIVDRKKDLIITGGENIYPREVEEVLFEHPDIQEAAVVGVPHPYGGEIAKAFIVAKPGVALTKKDVIQFAGQHLAKHKVPRAVEFRDELPKSAAQKVLRRVLADEERARQAQQGPRRPRNRRPS